MLRESLKCGEKGGVSRNNMRVEKKKRVWPYASRVHQDQGGAHRSKGSNREDYGQQ